MGLYEDILELSTENADRENGLRKISELCKWRSIPEDGLQCITSPKEAIVNFTNAVFEKGFSTKGTGRGVGMYHTKQLVESLGGKISFESEKDTGTIFMVEL